MHISPPPRILTRGGKFILFLFAFVCVSFSQVAFAETVTGLSGATNYDNQEIIDNLGKDNYSHTGTISGTSSLTINSVDNINSTAYRQSLKGTYTFDGSITVNSGQLLAYKPLQTKDINLIGGDMYVMYTDALPHDAVVNVGSGCMLDVEVQVDAIQGAVVNVSSGGSFRIAAVHANTPSTPITLNIAGTGRPSEDNGIKMACPGAITAHHGNADLKLAANINLTDDATIFLTNMGTGYQFLLYGKLTGSSALTLASDNAGRWITLNGGTSGMNVSEFSGNFVVDKVQTRFYTDSLGTGSNITAQNSGTAIFNNTTALNNYNGSFTVNNATIKLEAAGKLNNLSGDADGKVNNNGKALTLNNTDGTTFNGVISGTGSVTKIGAGTLTLSGANTYSGETTVSEGTLKLTGAAVVANSLMTVGANGTLEYNLANNQTERLTIEETNAILSTGTIKKTGDGTLKLFAADEDLITSQGFVVSSGRLDMTKYFKGALTVGEKLDSENYSTAIFSPGNSVGSLDITGNFTLNPGSTLLMEINGADAESNDQLIVDGTTLYQDNSLIQFALAPDSTYFPALGDEIQVKMPEIDDWSKVSFSSYYFTLKGYEGGNVILGVNPNAVPEPSTWALLLLGAAGLLYVRKRKN